MKMRSGKNIWEEGMIWRDDLKKWQIQEMYEVEKGVEGRSKGHNTKWEETGVDEVI